MSTVDQSDIRGSDLGSAVIIVIRRELPRTRDASQTTKGLSHSVLEDPPVRRLLDRRLTCSHLRFRSELGGLPPGVGFGCGSFDRDTDGPDEPQQLTGHSGHDLLFDLPLGGQTVVATV